MIQFKLAEIRHARKYTTRQLAARSGISHVTISRIENNLTDPNFTTVIILAQVLRVPIEDLYEIKRP